MQHLAQVLTPFPTPTVNSWSAITSPDHSLAILVPLIEHRYGQVYTHYCTWLPLTSCWVPVLTGG